MSWFKRRPDKAASGGGSLASHGAGSGPRLSYRDATQPPEELLDGQSWERLVALWDGYLRASEGSLGGRKALVAADAFNRYATTFCSTFCGEGQAPRSFDQAHHPASLCTEMGRILLVLGGVASRATPEWAQNAAALQQPPSTFLAPLMSLAEFLSRHQHMHRTLAESEVPLRATALSLALLQELSQANSAPLRAFASAVLRPALLFVERVFDPAVSWIQPAAATPAGPVGRQQLDCLESLLSGFAPSSTTGTGAGEPGDDWFERTVCLLNGWMRSAGERVQMVTSHQPLRTRLIHLLRGPARATWAIEALVAVMATLPEEAGAEGSDAGNHAAAVVFGFLGQLSAPPSDGEDPLQHARRTAELLSALLRGLSTDAKGALGLVALQAGVFDALVRLLEVRVEEPQLQAAVQQGVVRVQVHLLRRGTEFKALFAQQVGYDRLFSALFTEGQIDKEMSSLFLEIVVGSPVQMRAFSQSGYTITNTEALSAFLGWVPNVSPESSDWLLRLFDSLLGLCGRTYFNLSRCCYGGVLDAVLRVLGRWDPCHEEITEKLVQLVEMLGGHSVSVDSLKLLLNLMNVEHPTFQRHLYLRLQSCMQAMARHSDPVYFFDFHGAQSMLWIPQVERPSSAGYTLHLWMRLESLTFQQHAGSRATPHGFQRIISTSELAPASAVQGAANPSLSYEPRLYSFYGKNGCGLEAFFTAGRLAARTVSKSGAATHVFSAVIPKRRWICLTIVHRPGRGPFNHQNGEVRLFLNGELKDSGDLRLPEGSGPFLDCRLGRGRDVDEIVDIDRVRCGSTCLRAQIASAYMLEPLSDPQVWAMASLGINYYGTFEPCSLDLTVNHTLANLETSDLPTVPPQIELLCEANLHTKVNMYISAKLCDGNVVRDQAAYATFRSNWRPAELTGTLCIHRSIKEVVNAVGGISIFCFLLNQLDLVLKFGVGVTTAEQCLDRFFALLAELLENDAENVAHAIQNNTLAMVRSLLLGKPYARFSPDSLQSLQRLLEVRSPQAELVRNVLSHLLLDFRLWRRARSDVQSAYIQVMSTIVRTNLGYCRAQFGVQYMLDFLRLTYEDERGEAQGSGAAEAHSLDEFNYQNGCLAFISLFLEEDVSAGDVSALLSFCVASKHDVLCALILQYLYGVLHAYRTTSGKAFRAGKKVETLLAARPLLPLYGLLKRRSTEIHEHTLAIVAYFCNHSKALTSAAKQALRLKTGRAGLLLADLLACDPSPEVFARLIAVASFPLGGETDLVVENRSEDGSFLLVSATREEEWREGDGESPSSDRVSATSPAAGADGVEAAPDLVQVPISDDVETTAAILEAKRPRVALSPGCLGLALEYIQGQFSKAADVELLRVCTAVTVGILHRPRNASRFMQMPGWEELLFGFLALDVPREAWQDWPVPTAEMAKMPHTTAFLKASELWCLGHLAAVLSAASLCNTAAWQAMRCAVSKLPARVDAESAFAFKAFILGNVMHRLSRCLAEPAEDVLAKRHAALNAVQVLMLVEETLCLHQGAAQQMPEHLKRIREELGILLLDFSFKHKLAMVTSFAPLSDLSGPIGQASVRRGGMLRVLLQLSLQFLTEAHDDVFDKIVLSLDQILVAPTTTKLLSPNSQLNVLWHLDNAVVTLIARQDDTRLAAVADLLKRELRSRPYVIPGGHECINRLEDRRFLSEAKLSSFLDLIESEQWREDMSDKIGPVAFATMEVERVDRGQQALDVHNQQDETNGFLAEDAARLEHHVSQHQAVMRDLVMAPFQALQANEDVRSVQFNDQLRVTINGGRRKWLSLSLFMRGPRGVIDDGTPASSREFMHWRLDRTENFTRMRLKLEPNLKHSQHEDASQARDSGGASPGKARTARLPTGLSRSQRPDLGGDAALDPVGPLNISGLDAESTTDPLLSTEEQQQVLFTTEGDAIVFMEATGGRLSITRTHVIFYAEAATKFDTPADFKWPVQELREIHFRRYNLRPTALEFFLIDQTNFFLNFVKGVREQVYTCLMSLKPQGLVYAGSRSPAKMLARSGLTDKWRRRQISNFDYIMQLNTIAGRTYNDLNQYPVFPWIISDYTSETLDLSNSLCFRDLSVPIGALNEDRREQLQMMYADFEDPTGIVEKFHYGTHYSNAGGVLHYLLRLEPFTSLHIGLQSGKFDHADRQFHSIPLLWSSLEAGSGDVKELIPEFFYLPDFLRNGEHFDLGVLQNGRRVDNVALPPWASSAEEFIRINRQALESEYVSANLHQWIDLIFGHKQKGEEAVSAVNVFYYTSYEGAVDLDKIADPVERRAQEGMIREFGQTPSQLLKVPHPPRLSVQEAGKLNDGANQPATGIHSVFNASRSLKAYFIPVTPGDPVAAIGIAQGLSFRSWLKRGLVEPLVTISAGGAMGVHDWSPAPQIGLRRGQPFTLDVDPGSAPARQRFLHGAFHERVTVSSKLIAMSPKAKFVVCAGMWDNSIKVASTRSRRTLVSRRDHSDIVTCLALDFEGHTLLSGCADGTCILWEFKVSSTAQDTAADITLVPRQTLYGHDAEITSVDLNVELEMAITGSRDGTCNIHNLERGSLVRTLRPELPAGSDAGPGAAADGTPLKPRGAPDGDGSGSGSPQASTNIVVLTKLGSSCLYSQWSGGGLRRRKHTLHVFGCNGALLAYEGAAGHITAMRASPAGDRIVTCSKAGAITIRSLHNLEVQSVTNVNVPIHSMALTQGEGHVMVGLRDGKLIVLMADSG